MHGFLSHFIDLSSLTYVKKFAWYFLFEYLHVVYMNWFDYIVLPRANSIRTTVPMLKLNEYRRALCKMMPLAWEIAIKFKIIVLMLANENNNSGINDLKYFTSN